MNTNELLAIQKINQWIESNHIYQCLDLSNLNLENLPVLPANLESLRCNNNELTSLCSLPSNLRYLYCQNNKLTSLPSLPRFLDVLSCSNNQLTSLGSLPPNLRDINCSYNQLTSIDSLSFNLITLNCSNNLLTSLPEFPVKLSFIDCSNNPLTSLPTDFKNLRSLNCEDNKLTSLSSSFPSTLNVKCSRYGTYMKKYYCNKQNLTSLPPLDDNVEYLDCSNNELTSLGSLPSNLKYLYCQNNKLTSLPELPKGIICVNCCGNKITNYPEKGSVKEFYCDEDFKIFDRIREEEVNNEREDEQSETNEIKEENYDKGKSFFSNLLSLFTKNGIEKIVEFEDEDNYNNIKTVEDDLSDKIKLEFKIPKGPIFTDDVKSLIDGHDFNEDKNLYIMNRGVIPSCLDIKNVKYYNIKELEDEDNYNSIDEFINDGKNIIKELEETKNLFTRSSANGRDVDVDIIIEKFKKTFKDKLQEDISSFKWSKPVEIQEEPINKTKLEDLNITFEEPINTPSEVSTLLLEALKHKKEGQSFVFVYIK